MQIIIVAVSIEIAGPWLGYWMILASSMTSIGMFEAEMSSDAWQVAGMAERGIIPKVFAERNKHGAPKWGIAMSLFGVLIVTVLEFEKVIDLLNLLFCFGQAIEYLAFINLRKNFPNMNRPWMIPLGFYGICIMLTLPLAFSFLILYLSSIYAACICITLFLIGLIVYEILEKGRHENWFEFEDYVPYCCRAYGFDYGRQECHSIIERSWCPQLLVLQMMYKQWCECTCQPSLYCHGQK